MTWWPVAVAAWLAWGLLTAWFVGRLGRCRFGAWVIGGPLSLPAIVATALADRRQPPAPLPLSHDSPPGAPRVLVPAANPAGLLAAATAARRHLAAGDTVVTLAVVVDADLAPTGPTVPPRLREELDERLPAAFHAAEAALGAAPSERLVLFGAPGRAIAAELGRVDYRGAVLSSHRWPGGRRALARLALSAPVPTLTAGRASYRASPRTSSAPATPPPLVPTPRSIP